MNISYWLQPRKSLARQIFYVKAFACYFMPNAWYRRKLKRLFNGLSEEEKKIVSNRVEYYIRIAQNSHIKGEKMVGQYKFPFRAKKRFSTYFFDLYQVLCYFDKNLRFDYEFGDVTEIPPMPAFVKSRPLTMGETNSVVLNMDKVRHFRFITDNIPFRSKKDMLVSRNCVRQPHRIRLLEMYFDNPLCNIGKINADMCEDHPEWVREYMTVSEQLQYKFVACLEGNDVATNLKWVMSSNSLAVMPKPKYETWFMEGTLIPDYHYVAIKDDFSDLEEKMRYYISHPDEAEQIIENAHRYIEQFANERIEKLVSLTVANEYFVRTGQKNSLL